METSTNKPQKAQIDKLSKPIAKKVAIIGAGPGGLAAAIALQKQGFDVQVYEKAQELRPAGTGLGLLPNGLNCLEAIEPGLVEAIKRSGCPVRQAILKNINGETIRANPTSRYLEKYGQPLVTVWWWRLQQTLASRLPSDIIHLNHNCIGFEQNDSGVEIYFDNGKRVHADLLLGADGLRSAIRKNLIRDGEPRYLGSMCWRSVIKYNQELLNPDEMAFIKGNQQIMYLLNVGDGHICWITRKLSPDCSVSHSPAEVKSRVLHELADWGESLRALVEATEAEKILEGPTCDRLPLNSWSQGRVTLLGDAAHPMAPALAQGANTSFEDAYELAYSLSHSSSIEEAFSSYEKRRIERTQIIQSRSALGEMRYYETDSEESSRSSSPQATNNDFQDWLCHYQPSAIAPNKLL
jgi:salicylate hydroxylase